MASLGDIVAWSERRRHRLGEHCFLASLSFFRVTVMSLFPLQVLLRFSCSLIFFFTPRLLQRDGLSRALFFVFLFLFISHLETGLPLACLDVRQAHMDKYLRSGISRTADSRAKRDNGCASFSWGLCMVVPVSRGLLSPRDICAMRIGEGFCHSAPDEAKLREAGVTVAVRREYFRYCLTDAVATCMYIYSASPRRTLRLNACSSPHYPPPFPCPAAASFVNARYNADHQRAINRPLQPSGLLPP